jgi:hypothetical protein
MTDARLKGEWLTAAAHDALSDAAYRVLHNALMHSAEQGTDGAIARRELRFLYPGTLAPAVLDEITAAGFWEPAGDGYQLIGWSTTLGQSSAADVEQYRTAARERQRRKRDRDRQTPTATTPADALAAENTPSGGTTTPAAPRAAQRDLSRRDTERDGTRDVTGDVGKDRTGQDRPVSVLAEEHLDTAFQGGERTETRESVDQATGEILDDGGAIVAELIEYDPDAEPPLFCDRHPGGSSTPCAGCGDARRAHKRWARDHPQLTRTQQNLAVVARYERDERHRGKRQPVQLRTLNGREVCADGNHVPLTDGTCMNCEIRAIDLAASRIGATA